MNPKIERVLLWVPGLLAMLWYFFELSPQNGIIGHDYSHQMVRFLIGAAHFWQNGFDVPHYTAHLCGGIAVFADPQSSHYSLPQWLSFWVDPWVSVRLTLVIFYAVGYLTFFRLVKNRFNLGEPLSHLGALMFVSNGFFFAHIFVGHLTHHSYFLLPLFLDLLIRPYKTRLAVAHGASSLALLLAYLLYSGGLHMFMVFAVAALVLLPHWIERRQTQSDIKGASAAAIAAGLLFLLIAAPKIYAVQSYQSLFVIRDLDLSDESPLTVLLRYFWFLPWDTPELIRWGEFAFGPWEYVGYVSKLTAPLLILFAVLYFKAANLRTRVFGAISAIIALEVLLLAVGLGGNDLLPGFNHYHNPIKILAALIPFMCLLSVAAIAKFGPRLSTISESGRQLLYLFAVFFVLLESGVNSNYFTNKGIGLGFPYSKELYAAAKSHGRLPPVKRLMDQGVDDQVAIASAGSKIHCYEPLFGYRGENLGGKLKEGPISEIRDGAYNLTHPGCLVYPDYFQCDRWSRVPESQGDDMVKFTAGQTASWGVPPLQSTLQWLALLALISAVAVWLISVKRSFKLKK